VLLAMAASLAILGGILLMLPSNRENGQCSSCGATFVAERRRADSAASEWVISRAPSAATGEQQQASDGPSDWRGLPFVMRALISMFTCSIAMSIAIWSIVVCASRQPNVVSGWEERGLAMIKAGCLAGLLIGLGLTRPNRRSELVGVLLILAAVLGGVVFGAVLGLSADAAGNTDDMQYGILLGILVGAPAAIVSAKVQFPRAR